MWRSFFFFLLTLSFQVATAQQEEKPVTAKINLFQKDIFARIDAVVKSNDHIFRERLSYLILYLKKNKGDKAYSKEQRQGKFDLLPGEEKTIATFKLNIEPDQELRVYLFIRNEKQLIAQDSVKINEILNILKTTEIDESDIELSGLVVDNVKTKIGREFYDIFYRKYNQSGDKYPFVITIIEKPFIGGRGALITIEAEGNKIFEFQARPDEDLLNKVAGYSLKLLKNYAKKRATFEKVY